MKIALALGFWVLAAAPALSQDGFGDDLKRAVQNLRDASSYAIEVSHDMESTLALGNRDVRGNGKYVKGVGFWMKAGKVEMFRKGKKTAFEDADGEWRIVGAKKRERRGGEEGRDNHEFLASQTRIPHEEIGNIAKDITKLEVEDLTQVAGGVECVVFKGDFTKDAARKFTSWADAYGGATRGATRAGSVKIWIDDTWTIRKYEVSSSINAQRGFIQIFVEVVSVTVISKHGETELTPPEEAVRLIDGEKTKK